MYLLGKRFLLHYTRGERADVLPVAEGVRGDEDESGEASEGAREGEPATEAAGGRSDGGQHDPEGSVKGKLLSPEESIPKLVETRVTSGRSGCGMSLAIGMDDPEFLLNRGTERREVAIAE